MSTQHPSQGTPPVHVYQTNAATHGGAVKSASGAAVVSLFLCTLAVVSAFPLLVVPVIGFLPAVFAGAGIVVAGTGLRGATRGNGAAVTALVLAVILFAGLAGLATLWHVVVAGPTVADPWFTDAVEMVWDKLFGF